MAGESLVPLLLGGTLLAVVLGMMITVRAQRRRATAARAWAHARGWEYVPSSEDVHGEFTGPPFGRGHSRADEHVLRGRHAGRQVICFDYRYVITSGGRRGDRHDDTSRHAVIAVRLSPGDPAGSVLEVEPRSAEVREVAQDPAPILAPEAAFDQAFAVTRPEPDRAAALLGPVTRSLLLQRPRHRWRLDGRHLLLVRRGELDLGTLDGDLDLAAAVLDSLDPGLRPHP